MNCPNCHRPTDPGAAFCGNCGQPLQQAQPTAPAPAQTQQPPIAPVVTPGQLGGPPASPIAQQFSPQQATPVQPMTMTQMPTMATPAGQAIPAYALPGQVHHVDETKATLSLVFAILSFIGTLLMVFVGLGFGIAGLVLATLSRHSTKRGLSTAGLIVSIIAIVVNLAAWVYLITQDAKTQPKTASGASHTITAKNDVETPCYSAGFADQLTIKTTDDSCDMQAFNGRTLSTSDNAFKVYGYEHASLTDSTFGDIAKQAIEKDISDNLTNFTVDKEASSTFAGSPSYVVNASSNDGKVAYVEAVVWHESTTSEYNLFAFVHAINGKSTDLNTLESGWQWK